VAYRDERGIALLRSCGVRVDAAEPTG
jgi:hypothetical protein